MFRIITTSRLRIRTDGAGIRTLIITHGCGLRCKYCINPQTWNGQQKYHELSAKQLFEEISLDRPYFMATGGGVTFGGGEPLQYADDIRQFKELCSSDFTVFAETSLYVPENEVKTAASCIDHFIVDIKTTDPQIYQKYTGGSLDPVLRNLRFLWGTVGSDRITVRIPVIPDFTTPEDQTHSKETLMQMGITNFDLFTYLIKDKRKNKHY